MTAKKAPKKSGSMDMSEASVLAAGALYRAGSGTLETLAKHHSVSVSTLKRYFKKHGIKKGEAVEDIGKAAASAVERDLVAAQIKKVQDIVAARTGTLQSADFIQRLGNKLLTDALREVPPRPIASVMNDMKVVLMMSQALKNIQIVKFEALGIVNEGGQNEEELPSLVIHEMGSKEIEEAQKASKAMGDDMMLPPPVTLELDDEDALIKIEEGEETEPPGHVA